MSNQFASGSISPNISRSDTYTAAANGTTVTSATPISFFGIQVVQTGTITAWDVVLEGSLDGTNFATLLTHTEATGSGLVLWTTAPAPVKSFRSRCVSITLGAGTNVIAYILGTR